MIGSPKIGQTAEVNYYWTLNHMPLYGPDHGLWSMDTQWRHKSKKYENLGWSGRQNMLQPYLKIWEWELIFGGTVKVISSPGVRSPCSSQYTNKTVMRIWQLEIEKPNSSHYLLSGITRGGVFMWISVKNLKICNG